MEREFDAYYTTVIMPVGLKHEFGEDEECTFKVNEPSMGTPGGKVTPDAIFQCDGDTKGIVCGIKSSIPGDEGIALKDVGGQVKKHADIRRGWKTASGEIERHSLLLLVRNDDGGRVVGMLEMLGGGRAGRARAPNAGDRAPEERMHDQLRIVSDVGTPVDACVTGWEVGGAGRGDVIVLNRVRGYTDCEYFDRRPEGGIRIGVDQIGLKYEKSRFVRSEPPVLYMMGILYRHVLPDLMKGGGEISVTVDGLMDSLAKYYTSWSGIEGERTQIRRRWVSRAMDEFCGINMAERMRGGRYNLRPPVSVKDVRSYLMKKLCDAGRRDGGRVRPHHAGRRNRDPARGGRAQTYVRCDPGVRSGGGLPSPGVVSVWT